jgi:hypothetical protein
MNLKAKERNYREWNRFESRETSRTVVKREDGVIDALAWLMRWALTNEKGKSSAATHPLEGQNAINRYISHQLHKGCERKTDQAMSSAVKNLGLAQKHMRQPRCAKRIAMA